MRYLNLVCDEYTAVQLQPAGTIVFNAYVPESIPEVHWAECRKAGAYPETGGWPRPDTEKSTAVAVPESALDDEPDDLGDGDNLDRHELNAIVVSRLKDAVAMVYEENDPAKLKGDGTPRVAAVRELVSDDFTAEQLSEAVLQYHAEQPQAD